MSDTQKPSLDEMIGAVHVAEEYAKQNVAQIERQGKDHTTLNRLDGCRFPVPSSTKSRSCRETPPVPRSLDPRFALAWFLSALATGRY